MGDPPASCAALLEGAEEALYSRDDPAQALALALRARELAAADDDRADAMLLAGEAALALDDLDAAAAQFSAAVELDADLADAHYGLGLVCEARGDGKGMRDAWLQARRCDLRGPHAPWHISAREFERIAEQAFAQLPEAARQRLGNVPILVSDYPSAEIVAEGNDPRMLGFFAGVPYGDKSSVGGGQGEPDCVFLYQRNIEWACESEDDLEREIHITLWHETAHFFGLDDDDLDAIGLG